MQSLLFLVLICPGRVHFNSILYSINTRIKKKYFNVSLCKDRCLSTIHSNRILLLSLIHLFDIFSRLTFFYLILYILSCIPFVVTQSIMFSSSSSVSFLSRILFICHFYYILLVTRSDFFYVVLYYNYSNHIINWKQTHNSCLGKFTLWNLSLEIS